MSRRPRIYEPNLAGSSIESRQRPVGGVPYREACVPPEGSHLTDAQAKELLRNGFDQVRRSFVACGLDKLSRTRFSIENWVRDSDRHFAACRTDGSLIVVSADLGRLPPDKMVAVLAHECGHAVDYLYPGSFMLAGKRLDVVQSGTRSNQSVPHQRYLAWERRDDHAVEVTADRIAEFVMQRPIVYCGPCKIQTFDLGQPGVGSCLRDRPRTLR